MRPMVKAFEAGASCASSLPARRRLRRAARPQRSATAHLARRAPVAGDRVAVTDDEMIAARAQIASAEGIQACLEGSATIPRCASCSHPGGSSRTSASSA